MKFNREEFNNNWLPYYSTWGRTTEEISNISDFGSEEISLTAILDAVGGRAAIDLIEKQVAKSKEKTVFFAKLARLRQAACGKTPDLFNLNYQYIDFSFEQVEKEDILKTIPYLYAMLEFFQKRDNLIRELCEACDYSVQIP